MCANQTQFAVFVKPWKGMGLAEMAQHVRHLGFGLIELPVRPGFAVEPEAIEQGLPRAAHVLGEEGVSIVNVTVALPLDDERLYAACAACKIGMNRVIFSRGGLGYWEAEAKVRRELDAALPLCQRYGVKIGIQHHYGGSIPINAMGLYHLVKDYDPACVGAIWDPSHNALQGEDAVTGLEIVQSHLCMVNLKNAFWKRVNGPEAEMAEWRPYFTSGRHGLASWGQVAEGVRKVGYRGPITLSAEYSAEREVNRLIVEDLAYAQELFD